MSLLSRAAGLLGRPSRGQLRLPVLMYHKVKPVADDPWTVSLEQLEQQWSFLHYAGYHAIRCAELLAHLERGTPLSQRSVLITFDDGYLSFREHAVPLLEKHALRATVFLPVKFIGGVNAWDGGSEPLLSYAELAAASAEGIELGLHSYGHPNYRRLTLAEIADDLRRCTQELTAHGVRFVPALAYPFGGRPRGWLKRRAFKRLLSEHGIGCGLRIGNRVNRLPIADRYAITRLDIRSDVTLDDFRRMLES